MIHIKLILTIFSIFSIGYSYANPYQEFVDKKIKTYSSAGDKKSHGLEINFNYPESWGGEPGKRPNTLYQVTSKNGLGFESCNLLIRNIPIEISNEIDNNSNILFEHSTLASFVPSGRKIVSIKNTKIDGIPAGVIETSFTSENAGLFGYINNINYITYYDKKLISLNCMTYSEDKKKSDIQYRNNSGLFNVIANSIIIMNRWK